MKRFIFLMILASMLTSAYNYTVCSSGCNTTSLTTAMDAVNNTNNTIIINESGTYYMPPGYAWGSRYLVEDSDMDGSILITADNVTIQCKGTIMEGGSVGYGIYSIGDRTRLFDCMLEQYGIGIYSADSSNHTIRNTTILASTYGIRLENTNHTSIFNSSVTLSAVTGIHLNTAYGNHIYTTTISSSTQDISCSGTGSINYIEDSSFDSSKLSFTEDSQLFVGWNFIASVNDSYGNPFSGNLLVSDTSRQIYNLSIAGTTTSSNITEYMANSSGFQYFTNYSFYAYNATSFVNASVNVSTDGTYYLTVDVTAPNIQSVSNVSNNESALITVVTDDKTNLSVNWGINSSLGTVQDVTAFSKTSVMNITGLDSNTTYYYNVTVCNDQGMCVGYGTYSFSTDITVDITAPVISSITNTTGNDSIYITFSTNDAANATIEYGTNISLVNSATDVTFDTSTAINLTSLINNTLYYYNITVCNSNGFCTKQGLYNATTNQTIIIDSTPPAISSLSNTTTNESIYITFSTDDTANATIEYGTDTDLTSSATDTTFNTSTAINLTSLTNNTLYYFNITACNIYSLCTEQGPYQVTTDQTIIPDTTAPVISSIANATSNESIYITFNTDDSANATIEYGENTSLLSSATDATFDTSTGVNLTGLTNNTLYYFNITACNNNSLCTEQGPYQATTEQNPDTVAPTISTRVNTSTTTTATINLTTDKGCNATLEIGETTAFGTTTSNAGYPTIHSFTVLSLNPGTPHYYNITVCNSDAYCNEYGPYSFTTVAASITYNNHTLQFHVNDTSGNDLAAGIYIWDDSSSLFASGTANASGIYTAELTENFTNASGTFFYGNYTYKVAMATKIAQYGTINISADTNLSYTLANQTGTLPSATVFTSSETTDFDAVPDLTNASDVTIANSVGKINFPGEENFSGADIDTYVNISNGTIALDATNLPNLNTSAVLTIYGVTCPVNKIYYTSNYTTNAYSIYTTGTDCEASGVCTAKSCTGSTLTFNVSHFSSFAVGNNANLSIWDTTDSITVYNNQQVFFYANYSSTAPINTSSSYCELSVNDTFTNMTFNGSVYVYNRSLGTGNHTFNIYCDAIGYDNLSTSDNTTVLPTPDTTPPVITINTPSNNTVYSNDTTSVPLSISTNETAECRYSTSSGFSYATGTPFTVTNATLHTETYSVTEGNNYNLYFRCNDTSGNINSQIHLNFTVNATIDINPPSITVASPSNSTSLAYTTTSTTLSITTGESCDCEYSTSSFSFGTGTAFTTTGGTSHSSSYSVSAGNSYDLYYVCNDTSGNQNTPVHHTFDVDPVPPDTTPPVISSVSATPTNVSATISWSTDESSDTRVKYGTVSGSLTSNSYSATMSTSHSRTLTGLTSDTTYYYVVNSTDSSGNSAESSEGSFTTLDLTRPIISSVSSSSVTGTTATITWSTDEASDSQVVYGTSSNSYTMSKTSASMVTSHSVSLTGLSNSRTYYYRVVSNDSSGNSDTSSQKTFTTLDTTAPTITFSTPVNETTTVSDVINVPLTVTTNEAATCTAEAYKIGSSETTTAKVLTPNSGNTSHSSIFNATGESNGYDFYFTVVCKDASTNTRQNTVYFRLSDSTDPSADFKDMVEDDSYTTNTSLLIRFKTSEPMATGFPKISIDGGSNATVAISSGYYRYAKTMSETEHNISLYLADPYGNDHMYSRTYTVDNTEPEIDDIFPEDDEIFRNCKEVVFNVTLSEEGSCEYTYYTDQEDEYEECLDECDSDKDDCDDDADTDSEEDQCEEDLEDCELSCRDDRYEEEDTGEMDEAAGIEECQDSCEDDTTECEQTCEDEKDECYDDADGDNDDEDDCDDDEDECIEDCADDEDECMEDCEDGSFIYEVIFDDECFDDAVYLVDFNCEDLAGNDVYENVTFEVSDNIAPTIEDSSPDGKVSSASVDLRVTTSEDAECRFDEADVSFDDMNYTMKGTGETHTYELENLENTDYKFYVRCEDTPGNQMTSSEVIQFTVNSSDASTTASHTFKTIKANTPAIFTLNKQDISVTGIEIITNTDLEDASLDVKKIADTTTIKKASDTVYQYLEIEKEGISNKDIVKVTIEFKVEKSWITSQGLDSNDVSMYKYTTKWEEVPTNKISEDSTYVFYDAETTGFSVFAVLSKSEPAETTTTQTVDTTTTEDEVQEEEEEPLVEEPADVEEGSNLWIYILLCVLVVGGGTAGFFVYKSHRHPQQNSEADPHIQPAQAVEAGQSSSDSAQPSSAEPAAQEPAQQDELSDYINQCLQAGISPDEIKSTLLENGYSESEIEFKLGQMGIAGKTDELAEYVSAALAAGQSPAEMAAALLGGGYTQEEIDAKFTEMGITKPVSDGEAQEIINNTNQDHEVLDYIQSSLQYGMSHEQMKAQLVDQGFEPDYVDAMIKHVDASNPGEHTEVQPEQTAVQECPADVQPTETQTAPEQQSAPEMAADPDDEVMAYIKKGLQDKIPKKLISKALMESGHTKIEINKKFAEIEAVEKKLKKDLKAYVKAQKKAGKKKPEIKKDLLSQGFDEKMVKKVV